MESEIPTWRDFIPVRNSRISRRTLSFSLQTQQSAGSPLSGRIPSRDLRHIYERTDQSQAALLRFRYRRKGRDPAIEENVTEQRFGAIVGGMAKRENRTAKLRRNL